jgi:hypothetical protein
MLERDFVPSPILPQAHESLIHCNARQPCGERRFPFERVEMRISFVKALLHYVLSILSVSSYLESYRENPAFVSLHQKFECATLAFLCGCN